MIPILAFGLGALLVVAIGAIGVLVRIRRRLDRARRMIDELAPMMGFVLAVAQSRHAPADLRAIAQGTIPTWLDDLDRGQLPPDLTVH